MITPIFDFFEKLIDQFSWRRLMFSAFILLSAIICLVIYESYTGTFRLQKIDRIIALSERANHLGKNLDYQSQKNINDAVSNATRELAEFTKDRSTELVFDSRVLKGLAAFFPWLLLMIILPIASPEGAKAAIGGILIVAIPFSILGAFLPDFRYNWINYLIYPFGHFFMFLLLITWWNKRKRPN